MVDVDELHSTPLASGNEADLVSAVCNSEAVIGDVGNSEAEPCVIGVVGNSECEPCVAGSTVTSGIEVDLVGVIANSEDEAYDIYNDYAFNIGFTIRKDKSRYRADNTMSMKMFVCSRAGLKKKNSNDGSYFSRLDTRCNCPALIKFDVGKDGCWIVDKHVKDHNHELCPPSSSYLLNSHRRISVNQLVYLKELKRSGIGVADSVKVLKNQYEGSPFVGFGVRDAYNMMSRSKVLDGTDSNTLINIFKSRQSNEVDFFYFEVDNESRLCSFYWRDRRMRQDYDVFGDLVVHDTTYRTNKYDMICGSFVGMNHHGMNIMFGCGFLLNEWTESFECLFGSFLRSMGGKHPETIMTDQSGSMSLAISKIFPLSRHILCLWHIGENSKKHIASLRCQNGFMELFNKLLKHCDNIAEFEHYWSMMMSTYQCHSNKWLRKLYQLREKWCPTFNKDWFSGGILSSQRSESTNPSSSRRLSKTAGLCDFYHSFVDVVSEWRSKENGEDIRCNQGKPPSILSNAKLVLHTRDIYTIEAFYMFEEQFLKGAQCYQLLFSSDVAFMKYHVWVEGVDRIKHEVMFRMKDHFICCTCKYYEEVGILCCHCLRILNIHCICAIPKFFIKQRWCKDIAIERCLENDLGTAIIPRTVNMAATPLWRMSTDRKFYRLITASENNASARLKCEKGFQNIRCSISEDIGPVFLGESGECASSSSGVVQNPENSSLKYKRNRRPKSIVEKKYNQANGKRRCNNSETRSNNHISYLQFGKDKYIVHPSSGKGSLHVVTPSTSSTFVSMSNSSIE